MKNIVVFFFLSILCIQMNARQITVCKDCEVKTLKAAIAMAHDGDEIIVKAGIYKEHKIEIIGKSLKFIGEGQPVIDGEFKETIFHVKAANFSIEGFTIVNVGKSYTKDFAAILISRSKNFTIKNNVFKDVFFGILIEKSHYGTISGNDVSSHAVSEASSGNGVHAWHSTHLDVHDNHLTGLRDGIYLEFVEESIVYNNVSINNVRYGLHFMFSHHNEYHHNTFRNNGAGVAVMFSKYIKMHHNSFTLNWGSSSYGLLLKEIYDAEIYNNEFRENTIGINLEGTTRINYRNNNFIRNGWAVRVRGACYENVFERNNFMHNAFDLSYNSKINSNIFDKNYWSEYAGYDLDRDGVGDVPYRPVKLFSYVVNRTPETIVLLRSLFVDIINFSEKVSPVFTPDNLLDENPQMRKINDSY